MCNNIIMQVQRYTLYDHKGCTISLSSCVCVLRQSYFFFESSPSLLHLVRMRFRIAAVDAPRRRMVNGFFSYPCPFVFVVLCLRPNRRHVDVNERNAPIYRKQDVC